MMLSYNKLTLNKYPKMDQIEDIAKTVKAESDSAAGNSRFQPLALDFQPTEFSVICARGKRAYESPGNTWFRSIVEQYSLQYANATTKMEKSIVVSTIVETVRKASPTGSFIRKVNGRWQEVSEGIARERVGQTFRDIIDAKYRSSTHAKKRRRAKRQAAQNTLMGTRNQPTEAQGTTEPAKTDDSGDESLQSTFQITKAKQDILNDTDDATVPPQWLTQDVLTTSIFQDQQIEQARLEFSGFGNMDAPGFNLNQTDQHLFTGKTGDLNVQNPEKDSKMPPSSLTAGMRYGQTRRQEAFAQQQWRQEPASLNDSAHSFDSNLSFPDFRRSTSLTLGTLTNSAGGVHLQGSAAPASSGDYNSGTTGSSLDCLANAIDIFEQHPLIHVGNRNTTFTNSGNTTLANINNNSDSNLSNNLSLSNNSNNFNFNNLSFNNNNNNNNNNLARLAAYALEPAPAQDVEESDPFSFNNSNSNNNANSSSDFSYYRSWFGDNGA